MNDASGRRHFLGLAGATGAAIAFSGLPLRAREDEKKGPAPDDVTPTEDLMREHGALNRILLIYDHCREALGHGGDFHAKELAESAGIIRTFIEGYHEKLEEDELFPRFEKARLMTGLVATLREQHASGRRLTARIIGDAKAGAGKEARARLAVDLAAFNRMYRPHEAREDTELFPAFKGLVPAREWDALGDRFEDREHELLGKDGFEGVVKRVGELERALGIHDLASFTPKG